MTTITATKVAVPSSTGLDEKWQGANQGVQQGADMLARLGRRWGWVLSFEIITLLAGIVVLAWPGETLLVIAVLFGVQLIIAGIFRFVACAVPKTSRMFGPAALRSALVLIRLVYLLMARVFGWLALLARSDAAKLVI